MYQGKRYLVPDKCEMLDEKHAERETHTVEEQLPARNPYDAVLSDDLNNKTAQRLDLSNP